jgi:hypothetical protein
MATPDEGVEEDGGLEDFVSKAHNPPQHVMTVPDFLDTAADLRGLYDKRCVCFCDVRQQLNASYQN